MVVKASDTFIRANQSGWGTASDGETWAVNNGSATWAIASNRGTMTGTTTAGQSQLLGSQTLYPGKVRVRWKKTATTDGVFISARLTGVTTYYRVKMVNGVMTIFKDIAGTQTNLGSTFSYTETANTLYWTEFYLNGSTLAASVWQDGSSQPGSYQITTTDTGIAVAGQFGLGGNLTTATDTISFDSFTMDDLTVASNSFYDAMSIGDALNLFC